MPDGLSPEAAKLYRRTVRDYGGGRPPGFVIELETCCRTLDRLREAEATLQREGATVRDSGKPTVHPATVRLDAETKAFERQISGVREWVGGARMRRAYQAAKGNDRGTGGSLARSTGNPEEMANE